MKSFSFEEKQNRRLERLAGAALVAAAVAAVIVFLPPEGSILTPLHDTLDGLLGQTAFLVPLALALIGLLGLARRVRPDARLPRRRLIGVAVLAVSLLPAERLMGGDTGLIGDRLTAAAVDLIGAPLTVLLLIALVLAGAALTLNVKLTKRWALAAR